MKTLKDVYIKVTERNKSEIETVLGMKVPNNYNVSFNFDSIYSVYIHDRSIDKQKVSLIQLRRLIETIPTREEITRLKRQISAYKTNYDKVVKHSSSKEDVIEDLNIQNDKLKSSLSELEKDLSFAISEHNSESKINAELSSNNRSLKNLYESLEKESVKNLSNFLECENKIFRENLDLKFENERLRKENERLKNKKWYQIWK